jgi:hypothetical protein
MKTKRIYVIIRVAQLILGFIGLGLLLGGKIALGILVLILAAIIKVIASMIAVTFFEGF